MQKEGLFADDSSIHSMEEFKKDSDAQYKCGSSIELNLTDNTINVIIKRFFVFIMFF